MRLHLASALAVGLLLTACQDRTPTSQPTHTDQGTTPPAYVPAALRLSDADRTAYAGTLGVWTLDVVGKHASLTPARDLAATPGVGSFEVDITDALTRTFCRDCVDIQQVELDGDDNVVVTVGIRHPFELGDPGNPITAQNRRDLFLFNVKGTIKSDHDAETIAGRTLPTHVLVNPDGYTRNEGLFDDVAGMDTYPYMVFGVDELLTGTGNFNATTGQFDQMDAPTGFNVIGQGQAASARFTFDTSSSSSISVDLVLVAQYGQSVENKAQRMTPEYYPAEFAAGPWRLEMGDTIPFATSPGTPQAVDVTVWDFAMAHGTFDAGFPGTDYLGTSWDPDLTVEAIIPDFKATAFDATYTSGTGAIGDPLVYGLSLDNQLSAANGTYTGLLKVTSNRPVGTANPGEADDVSGIAADLDASNLLPISEIATYLPFDVEVSTVVGMPPTAVLMSNKLTCMVGNGIYFFPGSGTNDPDGTITQYVYDSDWDGNPANFTPEFIMPTNAPVAMRFPSVGSPTIGLRVRDNDNNYGYDSLTVNVVPVGDPLPPAQMEGVLACDIDGMTTLNQKTTVVHDRNFPWNVYVLRDLNTSATTDIGIHRSKDYGRTFDAGTNVTSAITGHTGDSGCTFASSGYGLMSLADGSLGLVVYNTSTSVSGTCTDGRGIYYVWIDADPFGNGVDPGLQSHDLVRLSNLDTGFPTITQVSGWGHPTDPTKALAVGVIRHVTGQPNTVVYCVANQANSANPVPLVYDELIPPADQSNVQNLDSYMDPTTGDLHLAWDEQWPNGATSDWFLSYMRISNNNPVYGGAITRVSRNTVSSNSPANFNYPRVTTIAGNQAVVGFTFSDGDGRDPCLMKVNDSGSAHSWALPMTRLSIPNGQAYSNILGDPTTSRIFLVWQGGTGTSGTATAEPLNISYQLFDSALNTVGPQGIFSTSVPAPIAPQRNHEPMSSLDPATGEIWCMYDQLNGTEQSPYRITL